MATSDTHHEGEAHCTDCARDQWRADLLTAAVDVIQYGSDSSLTGFNALRCSAVKVLQKAFDDETLPKGD